MSIESFFPPGSFGPLRASVLELRVHRWVNPETDCEYPFLAAPDDRSVLISLGNHSLCCDFELLPETERWLSQDFQPTGEHLSIDLSSVRYLLDHTFPGGVQFGLVKFDPELAIVELQLSPCRQDAVTPGPEYVVHELGKYERWYREADRHTAVTMTERAMLDVCCSTFEAFASDARHLLTEPPPPRFRRPPDSDPP